MPECFACDESDGQTGGISAKFDHKVLPAPLVRRAETEPLARYIRMSDIPGEGKRYAKVSGWAKKLFGVGCLKRDKHLAVPPAERSPKFVGPIQSPLNAPLDHILSMSRLLRFFLALIAISVATVQAQGQANGLIEFPIASADSGLEALPGLSYSNLNINQRRDDPLGGGPTVLGTYYTEVKANGQKLRLQLVRQIMIDQTLNT